ncbi:MAG: DUF192 domain-containing protein [Candidatus Aenigmarchaeota archaeon]|nr:DUF192 domain-containing protein [Candidatus Aenigmarchaeota archaeon]
MIIKNLSTGKIIAKDVELADTYWKRVKGLMFREGGSMLFRFKKEGFYSVWTLFMKFQIDIIFLDRQKKVIQVCGNARPVGRGLSTWRVYRTEKEAKYILEIPSGGRAIVRKGDLMSF